MSAATNLDVLWDPIRINQLEIANRLFVSAHTMAFYDDEMLGDRLIDYYAERARGGVGLLITGAEGVDPKGWHPPHFQAWREDAAPRYRKLADRVNEHGARVFTQLWHCGLQNYGTEVLDNQHPVLGPSGIASPIYGRIAKAMEHHEIQEVVQAFGRAAELAQEAGVDGVEVGGAHGYLISSFLSTFNNQRTDEYGGSVENRCRVAIEVAQEVRRRCGADYPVGFRMNFEEFVGPGGFEPAVCADLLRELHSHRLFDYFSITAGTYHTMWGFVMPGTMPMQTPNVPNAAMAKEIVGGDVPVMVAQKVTTVERAAEIVAAGEADLVAMTRAHLADPEVVRKARAGKAAEIRRCVGFNQGCIHRQTLGGMSSCTVNPAAGRERRWSLTKVVKAGAPRRIVVVGGGPAGMKLAEAAAERGHHVRLLERDDALGGAIRFAGQLPERGRWLHLVEDLTASLQRLGVEVELGVEATPELLREAEADLVVLATGARFDTRGFSVFRQDRLAIPGHDADHVIDPLTAIREPDRVGRRVVIVDDIGNHAALGVADHLGRAGKEVHLVTLAPMVGALLAGTLEVPGVLYPQLARAGVTSSTNTTVERIAADSVSLVQVWTGEATQLAADTVIINTHRTPEESLYLALKDSGVPLRRVGDCVAPRQVDEAIYEAVELAFDLDRIFAELPVRTAVGA